MEHGVRGRRAGVLENETFLLAAWCVKGMKGSGEDFYAKGCIAGGEKQRKYGTKL